ncbi:MAG: AI-2E family transporter YdiK, partial [Burkholderiales bacterium]
MTLPPPSRDLTRITLAVLVIGLLIVACLWILQPFLAATVWATMIVVATWPMMLGVQARLGGRRWAAVTVMTLAMLLVLVVPLVLAIATIVDHADDIVSWSKGIAAAGIPSPPGWVEQVPLVGEKIAREWRQLAATPSADLVTRATPYAHKAV